MTPRAALLSSLNIQPGERRLVSLALGFTLLLNAAGVLTKSTAYALFLQDFSGSDLPYTYIGIAAFAPLVTLGYLKLTERASLQTAAKTGVGALLLVALAYRLALASPAAREIAVFTLPITVGIMTSLGMTIFWNLLGRLFTLQQGKRLFGLLNSGEQIALLVGGLFVPVLVAGVGTPNLLVTAAGLLGASWLLLAFIVRDYHALFAVDDATQPKTVAPSPHIPRNRYIALMFSLYAVFMIGAYFVNNLFFTEAQAQIGNEDALASFLGVFTALTGGISLILQIFIAPRLLSRHGIGVFLLLTPAAVLLFMLPYAVLGALSAPAALLFVLAGLAHLFRIVFDAADTAAFNVLYQTIPALVRTRVQTVNDGILYPLSIGAAGVLLLLLLELLGVSDTQLAFILLLIIVLWLYLARSLGREYPRQVRQALRKRLFSEQDVLILEPINTAEIEQMLRDPRPGAALYALDLLAEADTNRLPVHLEGLLSHPSALVRAHSARQIDRHGLSRSIPAVLAQFRVEQIATVRAALRRTLAHLGDAETAGAVWVALDTSEPIVRQEALAGLLIRQDDIGQGLAVDKLQEWAQSANPLVRMQAAYAAGEAGNDYTEEPLSRLLEDNEAKVRHVALEAAGKAGIPALWPIMVRRLDDSGDAAAAAGAFVASGPSVLPFLAGALNETPSAERLRQIRLVKIIGRIGGPQAGDILHGRLPGQDFEVHAHLLVSMHRCHVKIDPSRQLAAEIEPDIERTAWLLAAWADLFRAPFAESVVKAATLLETALEQAIQVQQQNIFCWLSCAYDAELIKQVRFNLALSTGGRAEREQIAYAREIIDLHVGLPVRDWIKPVVSVEPLETRLARLPLRFHQPALERMERLAAIIAANDLWLPSWVRACSIYLAGFLNERGLRDPLQIAAASPDPLVAEMAAWALGRLESNGPDTGTPDHPIARQNTQGENAMLTTVEKVILLKSVEFFAGTSDSVLAQLAAQMEEITVAAGETIIEKGQEGDSMYVVAQGFLRVHVDEVDLAWMWDNEVFGEMSLLDHAPRSASVTAMKDSLLIRLGLEAFGELLEDHPEIGQRILQVMAQRLRIANLKLSVMDTARI